MANLILTSPAFPDHGPIPARYTCEGENLSPPLQWRGAPAGTQSFVLIIDDPDAPDPAAPKMTYVHWVLYDLPPTTHGLEEGTANLPAGTGVGINDWRRADYGGPCPPIGRHRYRHKLYALDNKLGPLVNATKAVLEKAMAGHILAETVLTGTYQKQQRR